VGSLDSQKRPSPNGSKPSPWNQITSKLMHHIKCKWISFSFHYRSDSFKITSESGHVEGGVAAWAGFVDISSGTIVEEGSDCSMLGGGGSQVEGGEAFCVGKIDGGFVVFKDGEDGWDVALFCCLVEGGGDAGVWWRGGSGGDIHFDVEFLVGGILGVFGFKGRFSGFEFC